MGDASQQIPGIDRVPSAARAALSEILDRDDPAIAGIVLSGSAARGTATAHSDVDVYVVLHDGPSRDLTVRRSHAIDEIPILLSSLERIDRYGTDGWWQRWSFAWARILRDATHGRVADAIRRQSTLTPEEQVDVLGARLDGALNLWYRALKADRDGRPVERRLDAAESVPWWLDCVFALEGRIRPYNRYLPWELREHPLGVADWSEDRLLPLLQGLLDGDPHAVREAYGTLEHECRRRDAAHRRTTLGAIIDGWGSDLALLRRAEPDRGRALRTERRRSPRRTPRPVRGRPPGAPRSPGS